MPTKLLIVESPTKAKTITRMLGAGYKIMASMGHVRDLPEHAFGVDVEHDFQPEYVDTPRSRKIVTELKAAAKAADEVYLAPDPDREGEAIAWHLREVLKSSFKGDFRRVSFHEITQSAIERALDHGGDIDLNLVDAQQARRVLDRLVGYKVSPLLWSQIAKGASAGRVQSVALRLVVERERAILAFVPEEYWNFEMLFRSEAGDEFSAKLFKINGENFRIPDADAANRAADAIRGGNGWRIANIDRSQRKRNAYPPFTTSTLQQAANQQLRFSASFTMKTAQSLYEGIDLGSGAAGLITYMRTDSVNIAKEAQSACLSFIRERYGAEYVPAKPNFYRSKGNAQEAHEAIRPTDVTQTPESLAGVLDAAQLRLYTLIWKRFVASQMPPAVMELLTVDVATTGADQATYTARANAGRVLFPGFTLIYNDQDKNDDAAFKLAQLGKLQNGAPCELLDLLQDQKFTEPPPRYSEAALIKELEENGIGRPSTYASIIRTIVDRKYVGNDHGKLFPTELGFTVTDFLVASLPSLFDVEFTSRMEQELDEVEAGRRNWTVMMREFYDRFAGWLDTAKQTGAPSKEDAGRLLELFQSIQFPAPPAPVTPTKTKSRRKPRTDETFVASVREGFEKNGALSARQFEALAKIAAKYVEQNPALAEFAVEIDPETRAREAAAAAIDWSPVFTALAAVTFDEPSGKGKRTFDDKKFVDSFKRQLNSGKGLSERQVAVLRRIVEKYLAQLPDAAALIAHFDTNAPSTAAVPLTPEAAQAQAVLADQTNADLDFLSGVQSWGEAVQRGKRTYDDKSFYQSLSEQHRSGRKLSDKQVAALHKMAEKYRKKAEPAAE